MCHKAIEVVIVDVRYLCQRVLRTGGKCRTMTHKQRDQQLGNDAILS